MISEILANDYGIVSRNSTRGILPYREIFYRATIALDSTVEVEMFTDKCQFQDRLWRRFARERVGFESASKLLHHVETCCEGLGAQKYVQPTIPAELPE
jgi:hypothetical protein